MGSPSVSVADTGTFRVYNDVGTVNVIIDVTGYYTSIGLQDLAASLPITASNHAYEAGPLPTQPMQTATLISVPMTAPGDGKVTVIAGAHLSNMDGDIGNVYCTISGNGTYDANYGIYPTGGFSSARVFDVDEGDATVYGLVCGGTAPFTYAFNVSISATYTPAA